MKTHSRLVLLLALATLACGEQTTGPGGDTPPPPPPQRGVHGTINGAPFSAAGAGMTYHASTSGYNMATGGGTAIGVGLFVEGITQPGTYPLHVVDPWRMGFVHPGGQIFMTQPNPPTGGPGQVTITTVSPTRLAGSASYTAHGTEDPNAAPYSVSFTFDLDVTETQSLAEVVAPDAILDRLAAQARPPGSSLNR